MKKNKNLLNLNILYSSFALLFFIGTVLSGFANQVFVTIISIIIIPLTLVGMWLLYVKDNPKSGITVLNINYVLKFICIVAFLIFFTLIVFVFQDCGASINKGDGAKVDFKERLKVIAITLPIFIATCIYIMTSMRFLKSVSKDKVKKSLSITYSVINIMFAVGLVVDLILTFVIKKSLVYSYINLLNISNIENSVSLLPFVTIFVVGEIIYIAISIFKSYLVLNDLKKRSILSKQ